ncbi:MAG TPA: class I SAM-dependent methyltransferase [Candidatus Goldiibacteriota bacterium]|nr:class I SAM-dependent methyltransferase [Candidatus Goldiibacteriota bacterium]
MATDRETTRNYERWFLTGEGMYTDEKQKELLINTARFKRGERVLEIGCGTGRMMEYLCDLGLDAAGVEPVEELVKKARQKSGIRKDQIIRAPYSALPLGDGSFDNVIFMNTFAFADDREKTLKEAWRVASRQVCIGFLNRYSLTRLFKVKARKEVYSDAYPLSGSELTGIVSRALKGENYRLNTAYTLFLPIQIAHFVPFVDDLLEKTRLPFGDFGVMVIGKLKTESLK